MRIRINGKEVQIPNGSVNNGDSGSGIPSGVVWMYLGTTAPSGWVLCDGTVYQIADYPELAAFLEKQHGSKNFFGGDGTNTFAVPDLRGRFVLGNSASHAVGSTGGSETVTLTEAQMPSHSHSVRAINGNTTSYAFQKGTDMLNFSVRTFSSGEAGSSQPHENMPPYYVLCYIVKL